MHSCDRDEEDRRFNKLKGVLLVVRVCSAVDLMLRQTAVASFVLLEFQAHHARGNNDCVVTPPSFRSYFVLHVTRIISN